MNIVNCQWEGVSGQWLTFVNINFLSNFVGVFKKLDTSFYNETLHMFFPQFVNLRTYTAKLQTKKQHLQSCYTDRSKHLWTQRILYVILSIYFWSTGHPKWYNSLPVLLLCLSCLQLWVKLILYWILFWPNTEFFSTYSTTDGPAHSFSYQYFLHYL